MNHHSDDVDLAACSRRARRCSLGLVCVLTINFSLVALALGGFGAQPAPSRPVVAAPVVAKSPVVAKGNSTPQPTAAITPVPPAPAVAVTLPPVIDPPSVPPPEPPPLPSPPVDLIPVTADRVTADPAPPVPADDSPPPATESLIVVNPPLTGGPVSFAVAGSVKSLEPGQFYEFAGARPRRVEYHRGDDFGYANHDLVRGCYAFEVGEQGWTLKPLAADPARKLLGTCVRVP